MNRFAIDVLVGLTSTPKQIPSKYFYDDKGSELFQKITHLPEYYLTGAEYEILEGLSEELPEVIDQDELDIIELGAGDGHKTRLLLDGFKKRGNDIRYFPIDISANAMTMLQNHIHEHERLQVRSLVADFSEGLRFAARQSQRRKLVLFLGSNIGNFSARERRDFLGMIWSSLQPGDLFLLGFDLKKDVPTMLRAYNDSQGITREFNLNLLDRMNRELGADFKRDSFTHYSHYNPILGAMESFLISQVDQVVHFESLQKNFTFAAYEPILLEHSYKVTPREVQSLALDNGFRPLREFTDGGGRFLETLWRVQKQKRAESPIEVAI